MGFSLPQALWFYCIVHLLPAVDAVKPSQWNQHDYEHNFVEAVVLITIVLLALAFETGWHYLAHQVKHGYHYGELHDKVNNEGDMDSMDHHGNMRHVKLIHELYTRVSGEFMTLGVLAFTIFASNQFGFFEFMVEWFPPCKEDDYDCFSRPNTSSDWLFLVEMVHMKLFLGMLFYFVLVYRLVRSATNKVKNFERRRLEQLLHMEYDINFGEYNPDLRQFVVFSDYFTDKIMRLRKKRASLHSLLCTKLGIDPKDSHSEAKIRHAIQERFSFAAYLALNIENGVVDTINVHITTWLAVVVLFSIFAVLHRLAKVPQSAVLPIIIVLAFAVLLSMWQVTRHRLASIHRHAKKLASSVHRPRDSDGSPSDVHSVDESAFSEGETCDAIGKSRRSSEVMNDKLAEGIEKASHTLDGNHNWSAQEDFGVHKHSRERIVLRIMQLVVFTMSYCAVSAISDANMWRKQFYVELAESMAFMILWFMMATFIPVAVPNFLCLMCIPPFVDDNNLKAFWTVLDDHILQRKGKAVSFDAASLASTTSNTVLPRSNGIDAFSKDRLRSLTRRKGQNTADSANEAVWELADILSVRHELEMRMKERDIPPSPGVHSYNAWSRGTSKDISPRAASELERRAISSPCVLGLPCHTCGERECHISV